nr:RNA-dependent RNA polymerase [Drosophila-associated narnavirus 5]
MDLPRKAESPEGQTYGLFPWSLKDRYRKNGKKFSKQDLVLLKTSLGGETFRVWCCWGHLSKINAAIHADEIVSSMRTMFLIGSGRGMSFFDREIEERALKSLFRVSLFNPSEGEKFVKDYTQAWKDYLKGKTRKVPHESPLKGIYPCLLQLPEKGSLTKEQLEILAIRCQSRHLPAPSLKYIDGKMEKFLTMVTSSEEPRTSNRALKDLTVSVKCLLRDVKRFCEETLPRNPLKDFRSHCSISKVGTFETPLSEGGRAEVMRKEILEFLEHIPESDESYDLPWGTTVAEAGVPRWKRFCVDAGFWKELDERPNDLRELCDVESELYRLFKENNIEEYYPRFNGITPFLGQQILGVAVVTLPKEGRNSVIVRPIPEGGGKIRFITMCRWQVVIIQQVVNHHLVEVLSTHPYMGPLFQRANLAWVTLDRLASFRDANPDLETQTLRAYVSDFSSATDSIHKDAVRCVWDHIFSILYEDKAPALIRLGRDLLVEPKLVHLSRDDTSPRITTRGIFMGEPLTKVTLTLLMMCVYYSALERKTLYKVTPKEFYFAPGDDHMALGDMGFVERIRRIPGKWGFILNQDKTSLTDMSGILHFCEEFFDMRNFLTSPRTTVLRDEASYRRSMWIDFPKLKLFNPTPLNQRGMRDEGYALKGKSSLLSQFLNWSYLWTKGEKDTIRRRFIQMCDFLLPKGKLFHTLLFPPHMGGLGLGSEEEIMEVLPLFSARFLEMLADSYKCRMVSQALRSIPGVKLHRGFQWPKLFFLHEVALEMCRNFPQKFFTALRAKYNLNGLTVSRSLQVLRKEGWWSVDELTTLLERCVLMPNILMKDTENPALFAPSYEKRWIAAYKAMDKIVAPTIGEREWDEIEYGILMDDVQTAIRGKKLLSTLYYIRESEESKGLMPVLVNHLQMLDNGSDLSLYIDRPRQKASRVEHLLEDLARYGDST